MELNFFSKNPASVCLLSLVLATTSSASEGVIEINQTCAVSTGCFVGDAAGFPITIVAGVGASYRLTGDLLLPDEHTTAIQVFAPDVSIDLGGFEIRGVTTCSGAPLSCSPTGNGDGINSFTNGVRVRNGSIVGAGRFGLFVRFKGVAESIVSTQNGSDGILGTESAIVRNSIANLNGGSGISVSNGATVSGNSASGNTFAGIATGSGATIFGNATRSNGTFGIFTTFGCSISRNTSSLNGQAGIFAQEGSLVRENATYQNDGNGISGSNGVTILDNSAVNNGDLTKPDTDYGISCGGGCFIRGNTVRDNLDDGISLGSDSAYRENVVTNNLTTGIGGLGVSNSRGDNYCAGPGVGGAFCP